MFGITPFAVSPYASSGASSSKIPFKGQLSSVTTISVGVVTIDLTPLNLVSGDFVLVGASMGSVPTNVAAPTAVGNVSGSFTNDQDLYANGNNDTNAWVWYKKLTGADTSITITPPGGTSGEVAYCIRVYTNVDANSPLDVASTSATGTTSDLPDPPSITPVTAGAKIVTFYFGAQQTSTVWGIPTDVINFVQVTPGVGAKDRAASGDIDWTSGAFDPVAIPSGQNSLSDSWAAVTYALRPLQPAVLVIASDVSLSQADSPTLAPKTALTIAAGNSLSQADPPTLAPKTALTVAVDNSLSQADNTTLAPHTVLTVASDVSLGLADNITLTAHTIQILANAAVSLSQAGSPTLASHYALAVQTDVSLSQADSLTIIPRIALTVANDNSAGQVDNLLLTAGLAIQGGNSLSQADSPILASHYGLTVQADNSLTQADNVPIAIALLIQSANSATQTDALILASHYALGLAAAISLGQAGILGANLVNGDGTTLSGWTNGSYGTLSLVGGRIRLTTNAAAVLNADAYFSMPTIVGHVYEISVTGWPDTAPYWQFGVGNAYEDYSLFNLGPQGGSGITLNGTFTATATTTYITITNGSPISGQYAEFLNIQVQDTEKDVPLASRYALAVQADVSLSQASSPSVAIRLQVQNNVSLSQTGNALLNYHIILTPQGANSLTQVGSITITSHILSYVKIGKDSTTDKSLAANPGTSIYKGDFYQVTVQ